MAKERVDLDLLLTQFREYSSLTDYDIYSQFHNSDLVKKKDIAYYNYANSFDIETSSFIENGDKRTLCYLWQLSLNGLNIYGRHLNEFVDLLNRISRMLKLGYKKRLIIYVHYLGYEFQFIRRHFNWEDIFAREERKPMQARTSTGIVFKCSYFLSGYNLSTLANNITMHTIKKLDDEFDYNKLRHSGTPLTESELKYSLSDILIVKYFIEEEIIRNGDITDIPLTQTGYVRRMVKDNFYSKKNYSKSYDTMNGLTIDIDEYSQLKRCFMGGFTHANAYYTGQTIHNVYSIDLASAYPANMLAEKYPMSKSVNLEITSMNQFREYISNFCCIFDIEFINIESKIIQENIISVSKCTKLVGVQENNGRVVKASCLVTTITEVDYKSIEQFYNFEDMRVYNFRYYLKGYLPKPMIDSIIELYNDKTSLKGVPSKESEYLHSKGKINALYGMCVTDIVHDEVTYKGDTWGTIRNNDIPGQIDKYNRARQKYLFYPWGIYVTAYTRRLLYESILEMGTDYIYSDTDSNKFKNYQAHEFYIHEHNKNIKRKIEKSLRYHKLPIESSHPKDKYGNERQIGIWEIEHSDISFKTLGSKRYLIKEEDNYSLTVAGTNKKKSMSYILNKSKKSGVSPFEIFTDGMLIPATHSGKTVSHYIDYETSGIVTDYMGNEGYYHELSSVHMENSDYHLSLSKMYLEYLQTIENNH